MPVEFLTKGLGAITGARFRHTTGAPRILVGDVTATELDLNAVQTANATRLTIRSGVGVNLRVQQIREENKVILAFNLAPMNPAEEALDYRDALIRSIRFDDTDGRSKVVIETTPQVVNVRLVPTDENRTFFVEFIPESAPAETVAAVSASLEEDSRPSGGNIRVIVIDSRPWRLGQWDGCARNPRKRRESYTGAALTAETADPTRHDSHPDPRCGS